MPFIQPVTVMLLCISCSVFANDAWELKKDRDGIQVYTRKVDGSPYKAVKAVTEMQTRLASLVAVVKDTDACAEWADLCKESWVEESPSSTEQYIYTHNALPWPVKDRDIVAHVIWSQDAATLQVSMHSVAVEGKVERQKGRVRLTKAEATWTFIPKDSQVEVVTEAHIDPAGPVPAWITNRLLVDSPLKTLNNLRKIVKQPKYQNASIDFIVEAEVSQN